MKKAISVILTAILLISVMAPAAMAYVDYEAVPIIYVRGNGQDLFDENGNQIYPVTLDDLNQDKLVESISNIILPLLVEGIPFDQWDNYTMAIYDELAPIYDKVMLDGDGLPKYGTGLSKAVITASEVRRHTDTGKDGVYDLTDYTFPYDWRLSPYEYVDELHAYIQDVMDATGAKQVSLVGRCMGGGLVMAYLAKYAKEGHIKNVMFDAVLSNGCALISESFSGKLTIDSAALQRYITDATTSAELGASSSLAISELMTDVLETTINMFNQTGTTNVFTGILESLYTEMYKAVLPPIALVVMATQANYWTGVTAEDFDEAISLIFGKEGDAFYEKYKGLIEKLEWYNDTVTSNLDELYDEWEELGIHIGVIAKYGHQYLPITESQNEPSDALVNLKYASFGATTANIGKTLSGTYIEQVISAGNGKYISPDKQVDLSTARFKDTTWVIKNCHHEFYELDDYIATDFCRSTNQTVNSENTTPQFMLFDEKTRTWSPMTEDNNADLDFVDKVEENPSIFSRIVAFFKWIFSLFTALFN